MQGLRLAILATQAVAATQRAKLLSLDRAILRAGAGGRSYFVIYSECARSYSS
jgi:hypothetical protein